MPDRLHLLRLESLDFERRAQPRRTTGILILDRRINDEYYELGLGLRKASQDAKEVCEDDHAKRPM